MCNNTSTKTETADAAVDAIDDYLTLLAELDDTTARPQIRAVEKSLYKTLASIEKEAEADREAEKAKARLQRSWGSRLKKLLGG